MIPAPTRIGTNIPSIVAARFSTFSCPYGWSASASLSALRTETKAITEATRSMSEWIASVRIAIDPVIARAASLSAMASRWRRSRAPAAPLSVRIIFVRAGSPEASRWAASIRAARPRWLIAFFSASESSDAVRWSSGPVSSGTKAGS